MPTIAAPALTANQIDYWIPPHIIQYCYGTHPSQSKFLPRGGRRVGMLAIGKCLKDQYDALAIRQRSNVKCPHCGEVHEISVRETYINGALKRPISLGHLGPR